jgi:hypothetical protein
MGGRVRRRGRWANFFWVWLSRVESGDECDSGGKSLRVKVFILFEDFGGVREVGFGYPGVFFGCVSFPSDQEGTVSWRSSVAQDPINFVFFFSSDKVRWWFREVWAVHAIFAIGR